MCGEFFYSHMCACIVNCSHCAVYTGGAYGRGQVVLGACIFNRLGVSSPDCTDVHTHRHTASSYLISVLERTVEGRVPCKC